MKKVFLWIMFFIVCNTLCLSLFISPVVGQRKVAMQLKSKLDSFPVSELPYVCRRTDAGCERFESFPEGFSKISYCKYDDFNGEIKSSKSLQYRIYRYFKPKGKNFSIVVIEMFTNTYKQMLVTCNSKGKCIDYLEVGNGMFNKGGRTTSWQWKIDEDMGVLICQVKTEENRPILWVDYPKLSSIKGQRVDTYYLIEPDGKFYISRKVTYAPAEYPVSFFDDQNVFLWDSKDIEILDENYMTVDMGTGQIKRIKCF